ncbi:LysR family transcriptional regulator [Ruegeria atlantica]|uniref:LysR family transcriptional regulator n=1 Tax=Ruegeria atlantica TaxID=81569 RepID=UPI001C2CA752|nr:LysR family transcriptional regulator [Ruegeria atlantica]
MRSQDLSLLVIFDAIMTEGSITRAADRLNITQPAVSNAVGRMRTIWKDDLFIKDGRNIRPTLFAQNLWAKVQRPLEEIDDAINPKGFDPATSHRVFRIAATDLMVDMAWADLRQRLEQDAPGVAVQTVPYTIANGESVLASATVDVLIGANDLMPPMDTSEFLLELDYVCVMRPDHVLAKGALTLERFVGADHLLVSLSGDALGYTDMVLAEHGLQRKVAMTINNFASATKVLSQSNLVGVLPSVNVKSLVESGALVARPTPIPVPGPILSMFWHKRVDRDQGNIWLRSVLKSLMAPS